MRIRQRQKKGGCVLDTEPARIHQNLRLLQAAILSDEQLYIWCYHASGGRVASSCPESCLDILDQAFRALGGLAQALDLSVQPDAALPRILGSPIGLQWAVTREEGLGRDLFFILGPVFYVRPDARQLRSALYAGLHGAEPSAWIDPLCQALPSIPILSHAVFSRYVLMVHNMLTGQQLALEDLASQRPARSDTRDHPAGGRNRMQVYQAERAMLQVVQEGNINYERLLRHSIDLSPGVPVHGRDPLRQMKTSLIVFITLVSRAAMEGGLSPEVAYSLGDSYIQAVEDSRDSGELVSIGPAMYHDFIYRVHHIRANPNYSHAIQKCCDYIELSLERPIRTADLAALVGYTDYYLTEKFRKETGKSISTYLRDARIARARVLLESTELSVADIAERLAFSTPSYFIHCFRTVVGCTPAQYRKKEKP